MKSIKQDVILFDVMFAWMSGIVRDKTEKTIVLDLHGAGYLINIPAPACTQAKIGEPLTLHIYTHVREDMIALYGFPTKEDLKLFLQLISVSGVGPKTGLEIMATPLPVLQDAIAREKLPILTKIPGIGKKTAERILVDLKGKILPPETLTNGQHRPLTQENEIDEDAVDALMRLGYSKPQIMRILEKMTETLKSTEEIVTYFLRNV